MDKKRQVVVVSDLAVNAGGSFRVAIDSCIALADAGVRPHLVHAGAEVEDTLVRQSGVTRHSVALDDVTTMGGLKAAWNYVWSAKAYRECLALFREIQSQGPTVVHVHSYGRRFSPAVFAAAKRAGVPAVLTLHDYFAFSPNGLHYDFPHDRTLPADATASILKNTDRKASHHWLRAARLWACKRWGVLPASVARFVAVSDRSRQLVTNFLPPERIETIYSPVSAMGGRAKPWEQQTIAFVGRLSREKGVVQLARAADELQLPVRFIGDGPDADAVRQVNPAAEITGWLEPEDVRATLLQSRAVVLPSRWHETFGLCVAEAQSLGIPAVVSCLAGSADWVDDTRNGLIFDPYTPGDLERQLRKLNDDPTVQRWSDAAYQNFANRDTSFAKHARELCEMYDRLLDPSARHRGRRNAA